MKECDRLRRDWALNDAVRDAGLPCPTGIDRLENIDYCRTDGIFDGLYKASEYDSFNCVSKETCHLTDIYYPDSKRQTYHVILVVHGGGWFYGNKRLYRHYAMNLAHRGFAVVCMNYRLAPEDPYPAALLDVCDCVSYMDRFKNALKFDMNAFFMAGDSAGAQLACQYAILATNEEYRNQFYSLYPESEHETLPIPTALALNCGVYDLTGLDDNNTEKWYAGRTDGSLRRLLYSATEYVNGDFPPSYLMCSVNDPLMSQTVFMRNRLRENNVRHVYAEYGRDNQASGHVFHLDMHNEEGKRCNDDECGFFKKIAEAKKL